MSDTLPRPTLVLGKPAAYARKLRRNAIAGQVLSAVALGGAGVTAVSAVTRLDGSVRAVMLVAAVVIGALAWGSMTKSAADAARAGAGIKAEQMSAAALEALGASAVAHGALLGVGGDADHVVLGPWAVVVETKHGRGDVQYDPASGMRDSRKRIGGDPVRQVRRQAAAVSKVVGGPVAAVVCVTGMQNAPFCVGSGRARVWVCSLEDLPRTIAGTDQVLDHDRALGIAHRLSAR